MNYQQALDYIFSYMDYEVVPHTPDNYDLRRTKELLSQIGNPQLKAKSVHIGGTNGKGSTAAMVTSVLIASGYTTGLYTSPHLHTINERIRVDGKLISDEEFAALVTRLQLPVEVVNQKATYGRLTTFELLTALAFAHFAEKEVNFQVLEVGLGGRFDATNVIKPEVCIITSISLDHTEVLGNSLSEIAVEKAGIIKPGSVVVTSPQPDEADRVIKDACLDRGARLVRVGSDVTWTGTSFTVNQQQLRVKGRMDSYELSIPLLGQYQLTNAATAVAALEVLAEKGFDVSKEGILNGLARVSWQGRFQIISHHPLLVVDGAHNPDAVRKLRQSLEQYLSFDLAILVIGASSDKEIAGAISELLPLFGKVIATRSRHPRAIAPVLIATEFAKHGVKTQVAEDVPTALSMARALAGDRDLICVTGSLFVGAEVIEQANRLNLV